MSAKILLIEDNAINMQLMTYLLGAFGHTTISAYDGEAGIDAARRESPDLILCDLQLPGKDGFSIIGTLKNHPALRRIPVIAVTCSCHDQRS